MSGLGSRFVKEGYKQPKPLIEVDGYPIIKHVLDLFPGVDDVIFICNSLHLRETNMREILLQLKPNAIIVEKDYDKSGPVGAVLSALHHISDDEEVIVSYCDYGSVWNFNDFLEDARKNSADGSIACYTGFHPHILGKDNYAFCKEDNNRLIEIREKQPFTDNKMNEYASNGTYYFRCGSLVKKYFKELVDKHISVNDEYYVSLVYNLLVRDGMLVRIFEIQKMLQWGTPHDLEAYKYWSSYFSSAKIIHPIKIENKEDVVTILPMAGKGSRFSEIGYSIPKPMIDVNGNHMVVEAVNCLPQSNSNIFICLKSHLDSYPIEPILINTYNNAKIVPIDRVTDGQATTCEIGIKSAKLSDDTPILISACDNGVYYDVEKYQELVDDKTIDIIVWSFRNNQTTQLHPNMYSYLNVNNNGFVTEVSVKQIKYGEPLTTHAIIGTMFFRKAKYFLDGYYENKYKNIRSNNEFYVDDVINRCIENGLKVKVFEVDYYICWGTPNDYKTYNYWKEYFLGKSNH